MTNRDGESAQTKQRPCNADRVSSLAFINGETMRARREMYADSFARCADAQARARARAAAATKGLKGWNVAVCFKRRPGTATIVQAICCEKREKRCARALLSGTARRCVAFYYRGRARARAYSSRLIFRRADDCREIAAITHLTLAPVYGPGINRRNVILPATTHSMHSASRARNTRNGKEMRR